MIIESALRPSTLMCSPMHAELRTRIRAVIFDFDGTLAETNIDFAQMRRRTEEHIRAWGLWEEDLATGRWVLEMIDHVAARLAPDPARQQRYLAEAAQILEQVEMLTCPQARLFPGVAETLACLAGQGRKLGIITRNCRRAVDAVLNRHPLPHQVLLTRDDVPTVKPDPAHLDAALHALGVPASRALMVGDHISDVQCGKAAGAFTCGVLTTTTTPQDFAAAGADLILPDVAALGRLLCESLDGS